MEFKQTHLKQDFCIETVDSWSGFFHGFGDASLNFPSATEGAAWNGLETGQTLIMLRQEHGKKIAKITQPLSIEEQKKFEENPPTADAWIVDTEILRDSNLVCGIRTADCFPVIVRSPNSRIVGIVHCGWRGAQAGLLLDVITQLARLGNLQRELEIAIGPGAQAGAYEIKDDVAAKIMGAYEFVNFPNTTDVPEPVLEREGKLYADIPNLLMAQSIFAGVKKGSILRHSDCTITSDRYFSHRRQKELAGRQLSFVGPSQK